jgi:hypothetical protein
MSVTASYRAPGAPGRRLITRVLVRQLGHKRPLMPRISQIELRSPAISSMRRDSHAGGVSRADYCDAHDCQFVDAPCGETRCAGRRRPVVGSFSHDEDAVERARERFAKLRGEF